uniref:Uncharacterized protein n=1 Tax=Arundo donax TaxID=35708 RepID=A0A0A9G8H1_ARUDO
MCRKCAIKLKYTRRMHFTKRTQNWKHPAKNIVLELVYLGCMVCCAQQMW